MSINSLHSIELQLIAQLLPVHSILAFARCCRFTLDALDSPFTFKCDPLVFKTEGVLPAVFNSRLTRHILVSLVWTLTENDDGKRHCTDADVDELLSLASNSAQVIGLDASHWRFRVRRKNWLTILSAPCMQQLRSLRMDGYYELNEPCLVTLPSLQQLQSLSCVSSSFLLPLTNLPLLTSLMVHVAYSQTRDQILQVPPALIRLRTLHLVGPTFDMRTWFPYWTTLSQLEEIELESIGVVDDAAPISADQFKEACRALKHMHTLILKHTWCPDRLLTFLHHAPSLRRLDIIVECDQYNAHAINRLPTAEVMQRFMKSLPAVTVYMELQKATVADRDRTVQWQSVFDLLRATMGSRLQIEVTPKE